MTYSDQISEDVFTVITPSYNSQHIFETIDSVLEQDFPLIEYIIVDDGSKSFDENAISKHIGIRSNIRLVILRHETNLGTVRALNDALKESTGKYIFELAADDCFHHRSVLSELYAEFESTGAMVITGRRIICTEQDMTDLYVQPSEKIVDLIRSGDNTQIFEHMCMSNIVMGCCTAYSRSSVDIYGAYDTQYRIIEDYPRYLYLIRKGVTIHFIDSILVRYRDGGISSIYRYNEVYEAENDRVMENEVFPYVSDSASARSNYRKWKSRRRMGSEFFDKMSGQRSIVGSFICMVRYSFKSPYVVALYVKLKIHGQ